MLGRLRRRARMAVSEDSRSVLRTGQGFWMVTRSGDCVVARGHSSAQGFAWRRVEWEPSSAVLEPASSCSRSSTSTAGAASQWPAAGRPIHFTAYAQGRAVEDAHPDDMGGIGRIALNAVRRGNVASAVGRRAGAARRNLARHLGLNIWAFGFVVRERVRRQAASTCRPGSSSALARFWRAPHLKPPLHCTAPHRTTLHLHLHTPARRLPGRRLVGELRAAGQRGVRATVAAGNQRATRNMSIIGHAVRRNGCPSELPTPLASSLLRRRRTKGQPEPSQTIMPSPDGMFAEICPAMMPCHSTPATTTATAASIVDDSRPWSSMRTIIDDYLQPSTPTSVTSSPTSKRDEALIFARASPCHDAKDRLPNGKRAVIVADNPSRAFTVTDICLEKTQLDAIRPAAKHSSASAKQGRGLRSAPVDGVKHVS
ncbi:hypothetical protein PMIN01_11039 [Paraphaeosphaeria minitans]|uniref:Uncharacterized protein n=1 Tax=Paraphaeosphaeria minitans TaxID=565426 RepID=A0A9P6KLQ4_9PLEO|nr:hypothetical protein PMIN01_11039 [Paraphaeosphaeria minitans]